MTHNPQSFVVTDPRTFDGDPFEVAERAVKQLGALASILGDSLEPARLMARNAELERQCADGGSPDGAGWPETPEGKRWTAVEAAVDGLKRDLLILSRVAAFNPKAKLPR